MIQLWLPSLFVFFLFCACSPLWSVCVIPDVFEWCGGNLRRTHSAEHAAVIPVWLPLWWGMDETCADAEWIKASHLIRIFISLFITCCVFSPLRRVSSSEYWKPDHNKIHHSRTRNCEGVSFCLPRSVINCFLLPICPATTFVYLYLNKNVPIFYC